jgi:hypothetical protein
LRRIDLAMTKLRRLSPASALGFGLSALLATSSWPTSSWAAPPSEVGEGEGEEATEAIAAPEGTDETDTEAAPESPEPEPEPSAEPAAPEHDPSGTIALLNRPPKQSRRIGDKHSIQYTNLLAPRINPLGLENRLWIGYQYRLYNKQKTILDGSNLAIFFRPILSPAIALMGATVQVQPAAVLRLRATYSWLAYFGTFQFLQSFQSPHDDWSETRLRALADEGRNYVTTGHQVELEALLQARVKGLVLRSTTIADYNSMKLRGDDDVFYDIRLDTMVPNNGWVLANDTELAWLHDFKTKKRPSLMVGGRVSTVKAFFPDHVYEPGDEIDDPNGPQVRVGPLLGYIFYDRKDRPRFNKPTLLLIPQFNVLHRYRAGRDVSPAFPTVVMALVFSGQLWGKN